MRLAAKTLVVVLAWLPGAPIATAGAQSDYPTKPIRLIVPYPPGGSVDFTAREVAQKLTEAWKVQIVIDNRGGAGATLGHDLAA